jgi:hypothetical protein
MSRLPRTAPATPKRALAALLALGVLLAPAPVVGEALAKDKVKSTDSGQYGGSGRKN